MQNLKKTKNDQHIKIDADRSFENLMKLGLMKELIPKLTTYIKDYHILFSTPMSGVLWEEIFDKALTDCKLDTTWKADGSHKVGEDMRILGVDKSRLSLKSGVIDPSNQCVTFSGSRSTKYISLQDKIDFFSKEHEDWYCLLAKKDRKKYRKEYRKKFPVFDKIYTVLIFPKKCCKINQLQWSEHPRGKSWIGTGIFEAKIQKQMSSQLWTTLPLDMIEYKFVIDCN